VKRLYIVRHCSAAGQAPDAPLTSEGKAQAQRLADFLKDKEIEFIITSPYVRAINSIEPLAERLTIEIQVDSRLSERILSLEPLENWLDCLQHTFTDFELAYDGGETSRQAMDRAVAVVDELLSRHQESVVVVTHGNLMTLLLRYFDERFGFEEWAAFKNPDVYLVTVNASESNVERVWG